MMLLYPHTLGYVHLEPLPMTEEIPHQRERQMNNMRVTEHSMYVNIFGIAFDWSFETNVSGKV